jgi:uncharacterized membrane protein (DUF485 family)
MQHSNTIRNKEQAPLSGACFFALYILLNFLSDYDKVFLGATITVGG